MLILAIETTCDETGLALVDFRVDADADEVKILAEELRSQFSLHRKYGGVVPILASRAHRKNLPILYERIKTKFDLKKIDAIAFAVGPGLPPALIAGKEFVVKIAEELDKKIIPVNHMRGHLYSVLVAKKKKAVWQKLKKIIFPALGLVVSGGHTELLAMDSLTRFKKLGETLDDAVGESLDKAGRLLELPYPGGPNLEKLALKGKPFFSLPQPMSRQKNFNFSFSGLKTALAEKVDELKKINRFNQEIKQDLACSYQKAAFESLIFKLKSAAENFQPKSILVSGGVSANLTLRKFLIKIFPKKKIFFPAKGLETDDGVKIALAGYFALKNKIELKESFSLDIDSNLDL